MALRSPSASQHSYYILAQGQTVGGVQESKSDAHQRPHTIFLKLLRCQG